MVASVNTNAGALQALATLRADSVIKDSISKKIQTGYKVADAFDDASTFAVSQGIRSNIKQFAAVQSSLSAGEGLGQVAASALKSISNLLADIKSKITQLSDGSLASTQIITYANDLFLQLSQLSNYITQATYNGKNILSGSTSISFLADTSGTTMTLNSQNAGVQVPFNNFSAQAATFTSSILASPGCAAYITTISSNFSTFENSVNLSQGSIAAETRSFTLQKNFINELVDATKKGLGVLVDADIAAESANLEAAKVREKLIYEALSIANQEPQALLSLFR